LASLHILLVLSIMPPMKSSAFKFYIQIWICNMITNRSIKFLPQFLYSFQKCIFLDILFFVIMFKYLHEELIWIFFLDEERTRCYEFFKPELTNLVEARKVRCEQFKEKENGAHAWIVYKDCIHSRIMTLKNNLA